ncbi:DNA cytosine methyltransferase, partial [candidate division WOR-3 bacterium]|nr:DNA cytosine methyltransferase [candidate division WOR-3 bacterium]
MRVIDLFCGAGGSSLGYKMAGFDVILAVDCNEVALSSYKANHPEVETRQTDIMQLTANDLPKADVILGSTPCQEFSTAKLNCTYDMTLTNHFLSIIHEYNPKYWMLENVPGIAK